MTDHTGEILEYLKLAIYYPSKLTYRDATTIRANTDPDENPGLTLVSHLLKYDYKEIENITSQINKAKTGKDGGQAVQAEAKPQFSFLRNRSTASKEHFNQMDAMMVTLWCCDEFLRQLLIEKLVSAKASVPILLLPTKQNGIKPTVLNWSLRSLVLETSTGKTEHGHRYAIHIPNPIISFIRIGDLHRSKSKLLSEFLNKANTAAFYHRDCPNASAKRVVSNGSIEVAWFQSSENSDQDFQFNCDLFTILNLRGDARQFPMQTRLLLQSSCLVVVMVNSVDSLTSWYENVRDDISWKEIKLMIALVSENAEKYELALDNFIQSCPLCKYVIDIMTDFNFDTVKTITSLEWKTKLREIIANFMKTSDKEQRICSLSDLFEKAKSIGFALEDETQTLANSRRIVSPLAEHRGRLTLPRSLKREPVRDFAERSEPTEDFVTRERNYMRIHEFKMFRLQETPLINVAELERKMLRGTADKNESTEDFVKSLRDEIGKQRTEQLKMIDKFTWPVKQFYKSLINLTEGDFMICLMSAQLILNEKFVYSDKSFGLEIIVRELGQMFEAVNSNPLAAEKLAESFMRPTQISDFATRTAELLLLGQPIELLNGETSYIPIDWIKAIFTKIAERKGDGKVFVLSVIGVQSTGKSTLLNALFGLHFPTSAGRCTSGVYCHLLPIDKKTVKTDCDHVMILDAEGFRAPEFAGKTTERDNEMATFIVGVSDLTIVNIEGENWSDMKDILEIVVYALLRIKQTKHKIMFMPSCVFVHQKISAPDVREKTKQGRITQMRSIDEMVEASAKREGYLNITAFSDVVAYNEDIDSHFLPNMYFGTPPFATINSEYCKAVVKFKSKIISKIEKRSMCLNFSGLHMRIYDLRQAILKENFVFSFRDTKQALDYQSLSSAFSEIEWKLRNSNHEIISNISNKILSSKDFHSLQTEERCLDNDMHSKIKENFEKAEENLKEVLLDERHKGSAELFRKNFETMLKYLNEEQGRRATETLKKVYEQQRKKLQNYEKLESKKLQILSELLQCSNRHFSNEDPSGYVDKKFKEIFSEEMKVYEDSLRKAKEAIDTAIKRYLPDDALELFKSATYTPIPEVTEADIAKKALNLAKSSNDTNEVSRTASGNEMCKQLFNECKSYLETLNGFDFEEIQVEKVFERVANFFGKPLKKVVEKKETVSSKSDDGQNVTCKIQSHGLSSGSNFTPEFAVRYFVAIAKYISERLLLFSKYFINKTDLYMEIDRRYRDCLEDVARMAAKPDFVFARYIVNEAEQVTFRSLSLIVMKMLSKNNNPVSSKKAFMIKLISDLARQEDFCKIDKYFTAFDDLYKKELVNYIQSFMKDDSNRQLIINHLETDIKALIKKIKDDVVSSFSESGDGSEFLQNLQIKLAGKITFHPECVSDCFSNLSKKDNNLQTAVDQLKTNLDLITGLKGIGILKRLESYFQDNAVEEMIDQIGLLSGCCEKCPFCSAPCLEQTADHTPHIKHHALHYPVGIRGTVHSKGWLPSAFRLHSSTSQTNAYRLVLDCCPSLIQSKYSFRREHATQKGKRFDLFNWFSSNAVKYKDYQKVFPNWQIPLLSEMEENDNDYWKWLMSKFGKKFADKYNVECPQISEDWHRIKPDEAVNRIRILLSDASY